MNKNIDELINCYFEQKEILELKNNKREKVGMTYMNLFIRRNTTEKRPEFNVGILFIVELLILSLLFYAKYLLWWIIVNVLVIILLIILHKKAIARWNIVCEEYSKKVEDNEKLYADINKRITTIEHKHKKLAQYFKILQNKILNSEIQNYDDAKLFLLNYEQNQTSLSQDYWECNYCGTYNKQETLSCINCGSSRKQ